MNESFLRLLMLAKEKNCEGNSAIARLLNESPQVITNWQNRGIPPKKAVEIADKLGTTSDFLLTGRHGRAEFVLAESYKKELGSMYSSLGRRLAPVISYVQAGQWATLVDAYPMGSGSEMIEIDAKWSKNSFVLKVRGDSMAPTLIEGAYIVVDPTVEWMHGRIVVVRQNGDTEVTVKRLQKDGDSYYLKADNPAYGVMKLLPDAHVCGVVVEMMVKFV
jgi:SOS-response transcriptional repressor LexA